jgi:predicted transposase YbfD/YdcC
LALDGNTVRNSATPGGMNVKLFAALLHHEQVVIAQIAVPEDTTEVTCVPALLGPVDLRGKAVTMDAAHTQDAIADYLTRVRDADYIMTVKGNRPHLLDAIAARMPEPSRAAPIRPTSRPSVAGAQGIEFPGAVRVFRIRRQPYDLSGQRLSKEVVHGVTSLNPSQATPKQLLDAVRHHWRIEAMHWIRDVAYREDHQRAYTGTGAQVMAMIRNVALAVPRLTGHHEITRTLQRIAADRSARGRPSLGGQSQRQAKSLPEPTHTALAAYNALTCRDEGTGSRGGATMIRRFHSKWFPAHRWSRDSQRRRRPCMCWSGAAVRQWRARDGRGGRRVGPGRRRLGAGVAACYWAVQPFVGGGSP